MSIPGIKWKDEPLSFRSALEFDNAMSTDNNVVTLFYRDGCEKCDEFKPIYRDDLAPNVHRTNAMKDVSPIVMTEINSGSKGNEIKSDLDEIRPGFFSGQNYPILLFKRADNVGVVWNHDVPRTRENVSRFMSIFYNDPSLSPIAEPPLHSIMNANQADFLYFYLDGIKPIPRFVEPIDPDFVDVDTAIESLTYFFLTNPEAREGGRAIPVDLLGRMDIQTPMIYDVKEDRYYPMRDSHRWIRDRYGISTVQREEQEEEVSSSQKRGTSRKGSRRKAK